MDIRKPMQFDISLIPSSRLGGLIDTFYRRCICMVEFSSLMCVVVLFILHFSTGGWNSNVLALIFAVAGVVFVIILYER